MFDVIITERIKEIIEYKSALILSKEDGKSTVYGLCSLHFLPSKFNPYIFQIYGKEYRIFLSAKEATDFFKDNKYIDTNVYIFKGTENEFKKIKTDQSIKIRFVDSKKKWCKMEDYFEISNNSAPPSSTPPDPSPAPSDNTDG